MEAPATNDGSNGGRHDSEDLRCESLVDRVGRVAHLMRFKANQLQVKLRQSLAGDQRQCKLIDPRQRIDARRPDTQAANQVGTAAAPPQTHGDDAASHVQEITTETINEQLKKIRQQQASSGGEAIEPQSIRTKRLSRKLNELLRRSLLNDIIPGKPKQVCKTLASAPPPKVIANRVEGKSSSSSRRRDKGGFDSNRDEEAIDHDVDGGYAWVVLAVIFVINASTFGTARAYGLIFDKLARVDDKSRTEAAMPFTIMGALENMAGPLSGYLLAQFNNSWRAIVFSGSCLITLAHLFAALTAGSQLGQLLSMGLMCGFGLSLVSISFFQLNNAYFVRYRSTAFGLGMTGAAFGTLYISPLCQYFLDNYGTSACYLMLSAILLPNVPLSLLLKPKRAPNAANVSNNCAKATVGQQQACCNKMNGNDIETQAGQTGDDRALPTISRHVDDLRAATRKRRANSLDELGIWLSIRRVICNPIFHLIWPTQVLFCWLNFVFGMIIVDFGRDRGLGAQDVAHLVPCWAFGQLVGRLCLSSLVDFKCLSYKSFTVICFFAISLTTCLLNYVQLDRQSSPSNSGADSGSDLNPGGTLDLKQHGLQTLVLALIFVLSMFIALLYILFTGLVVRYVEPALQPLSIGISSFTGSFFLLPRANVIGYYRDTIGNYDDMLAMFSLISLLAALTWLLVPPACIHLKRLYVAKRQQLASRSRARANMRVYSAWKLGNSSQLCKHEDFHYNQSNSHLAYGVDLNPNT